jgi:hypothetical protein
VSKQVSYAAGCAQAKMGTSVYRLPDKVIGRIRAGLQSRDQLEELEQDSESDGQDSSHSLEGSSSDNE